MEEEEKPSQEDINFEAPPKTSHEIAPQKESNKRMIRYQKYLEALEELEEKLGNHQDYFQLAEAEFPYPDAMTSEQKGDIYEKHQDLIRGINKKFEELDGESFGDKTRIKMAKTLTLINLAYLEKHPELNRNQLIEKWDHFAQRFIRPGGGDHHKSTLFLFSQIFQRFDRKEQEELTKIIDLDDSDKTRLELAKREVCKGMKAAEVAGWQYANTVNHFGGEADEKMGSDFAHLPAVDLDFLKKPRDQMSDEEEFNWVSVQDSWMPFEHVIPEEDRIDFENKYYDVFFAVGHGGYNHIMHEIADRVLKPDCRNNRWITSNEIGSIYEYIPYEEDDPDRAKFKKMNRNPF